MIYDVRLPRIIAAVLAGCGLAVAGGVFQALFGNPLASPYTLGVSNGAGFGAALAIVLTTSAAAVQLSALAFGIISVGLTFLLAGRKRSAPVTMILSGMLVSAFFSSSSRRRSSPRSSSVFPASSAGSASSSRISRA